MYRRILVPLDGSLAAEAALGVATGIARRTGATLELALVFTPVAAALAAAPVAVDYAELDQIQFDEEEAYLQRVTRRLADEPGLVVNAQHQRGPVVLALAGAVRESRADLVVMTTHGRGAVGRLWLGSVADGLIRVSRAPVLLLRANDRVPAAAGFRRLLLPLDESAEAEASVKAARDLVAEEGECLLLTVVDPRPLVQVAPLPFAVIPDLVVRPEVKDGALRYLERQARRLRRMGVRARAAVRVASNAAVEILEEADREKVDAIVVTTHGVGGIRRLLLGSVVDKLVRSADVPVLVCRPTRARDIPERRRALSLAQSN
jgi:nucleotide-binding universal stress UspA family protein